MMTTTLPPIESSENRQPGFETRVGPYERIKMGDDELAICGVIDLGQAGPEDIHKMPDSRILVLDVGFRGSPDGTFGPYAIDDSGEKRAFHKPYVLVSQVKADGGNPKTVFYEMAVGETVNLGRNNQTANNIFQFTQRISRNHASVSVNSHGTLIVADQGSTNGTRLYSPGYLVPAPHSEFGYTQNLDDFVHKTGQARRIGSVEKSRGWGWGEYGGRPVIARDTPINGGVYVTGTDSEAIVIDDNKFPSELNRVYEDAIKITKQVGADKLAIRALRRLKRGETPEIDEQAMVTKTLNSVYRAVDKALHYDLARTDAIATDARKVSLNKYIAEGVGVCRTQAALSAYVIERMIGEGQLEGRVSIDRNIIEYEEVQGGHAWARFTDSNGQVYIIDPAQHFVGTIEDAQKSANWDYRRSEDVIKELFSAVS